MARKSVTIRLPDEVLAQLDEAAEQVGMTRQDYLAARIAAAGDVRMPDAGPVLSSTRRDLGALVSGHPMGEALGAVAENLAHALDNNPGQLRAAIAKELKAILVEVARYEVSSADDDDFDFGAPSLGDAEDAE